MANQSETLKKSGSRTVIDKGRKFSLESDAVLENKGADQTLQNRFKSHSKQLRFSGIFLDYVSSLSYYILEGFICLYDTYMHMVYENVVDGNSKGWSFVLTVR